MKKIFQAAAVTLFAASTAQAQQAVQWKVTDGGNGHWYAMTSVSANFWVLNSHCNSRGGHLATFASRSECLWVGSHLTVRRSYAGAYQDFSDPSYSEPNGGWRWVTGEPFTLEAATPYGFDNYGSGQQFAWFNDCCCLCNTYLDDVEDVEAVGVIEWSADCNHDGMVDYGQIVEGQLADINDDGVPDCCGQETACDTTAIGLEAYLKFEGDCVDSSGNGRNGDSTAISYRSGPSAPTGLAAVFDGSTSDVSIEGIPIPTNNEFSWALWFRTETIGNTALVERIEAIGNNLLSPSLFIRSNGGLGFGSYSFASGGTSIETGPGVVSPGSWIHVACTSAASGLRRLYVNGKLVGENYSADYGQPLALVLLGRDRLDCCDRFRGMMDDFRVYSREITPSEVSYLVQLTQPADCNVDGIADYGQCQDGTLPDYNGNNVPDCCERGEACVVGNYPVQWRVEDGGNGHWYRGERASSFVSWSQAKALAVASGGLLTAIGDAQESQWVYAWIASKGWLWDSYGPYAVGPWIGGRGGRGNWRWDDGTAWTYSAWYPGEGPPSPDPVEQFAHFFNGAGAVVPANHWGDYFDVLVTPSYIVEWSADCNSDGIVDYGQILQGQLADLNADGVPDVCQQPTCVDADLFRNGVINGADLGILLSQWGPANVNTVSDINRDGQVNGADLGFLLANWGICN
jgi:hypothetical protein